MRVDGEILVSDGSSTSTLMGCLRRVDIETGNDDVGNDSPTTGNPCLAIAADEDLIADVLTAPTSWNEHDGTLLVRSNPKDAWIELRR
jgi:hypothetical protein